MWFINLLLALAMALAPEQASADTWDYATVRADMFCGLGGDALADGYARLGDKARPAPISNG